MSFREGEGTRNLQFALTLQKQLSPGGMTIGRFIRDDPRKSAAKRFLPGAIPWRKFLLRKPIRLAQRPKMRFVIDELPSRCQRLAIDV